MKTTQRKINKLVAEHKVEIEVEKQYAYKMGYLEGVKVTQNADQRLRVETATKFISCVGQSLQQFSSMLSENGAITALIKR